MLPQKISNAEIVVVVGADAEDVPSSIVEYLVAVVVASECEEKGRRSLRKDPTLAGKTRTHTYKVSSGFSTSIQSCVVRVRRQQCHESLILSCQRRQDHDEARYMIINDSSYHNKDHWNIN